MREVWYSWCAVKFNVDKPKMEMRNFIKSTTITELNRHTFLFMQTVSCHFFHFVTQVRQRSTNSTKLSNDTCAVY